MTRPEDITVDVREMPHVRNIAEFICENPQDPDELQHALWTIDAMSTADVQDLYRGMMAARVEA